MTIHLGRPSPDASRDLPEGRCENPPAVRSRRPFLFGLAPGGVYRAAPVSRRAVRSYRTLSPLPNCQSKWAVCFLWHYPWGRPRRVLPGTVSPWSPDFPPSTPESADSSHPTVWQGWVIAYVGALRKGLTGCKVGQCHVNRTIRSRFALYAQSIHDTAWSG